MRRETYHNAIEGRSDGMIRVNTSKVRKHQRTRLWSLTVRRGLTGFYRAFGSRSRAALTSAACGNLGSAFSANFNDRSARSYSFRARYAIPK